MDPKETTPSLPVPISRLGHRYFVYDLIVVKFLRESHNILGSFIGTLPQHSQQNVFRGLPLELMSEETQLLIEQGVAYLVDDVELHTATLKDVSIAERHAYLRGLQKQGQMLVKQDQKRAEDNTKAALEKMSPEKKSKVLAKLGTGSRRTVSPGLEQEAGLESSSLADRGTDDSLFDSLESKSNFAEPSTSSTLSQFDSIRAKPITPTTSSPLLQPPLPPSEPASRLVNAPEYRLDNDGLSYLTRRRSSPPPLLTSYIPPTSPKMRIRPSYALFRYLHSKSFFMSPGLRFGCQFCVYPGDPLRFHSHYLARGYDWEEEFDLLELVGGGRLGTRVKKSFLIGGPVRDGADITRSTNSTDFRNADDDNVRTFSIEWAGL